MLTLTKLSRNLDSVPIGTAWYLSDLGEMRGRQELYTRQSPQRLKALREHAMIESAVSSNRIEGVEIDPSRVRAVVLGKPPPRDRAEEEVRGYRDALRLVHESGAGLPVSQATVRRLHRLSRGDVHDAGKYRTKDADIIETYADGRSRVRFRCVAGRRVAGMMRELVDEWEEAMETGRLHPLIAMASFNLDFLCVHPFRDGNGRASRLLLLLQCYKLGFEVGRYISLERVIEENKERYYETLEQSSRGWHEGKNDPWPYVNYLLFVMKTAYKEFEGRVGEMKAGRGEKTELVMGAVRQAARLFRIGDIERRCPGVSLDLIRQVLKRLAAEKAVECTRRGPGAEWRKLGRNSEIG